MAHSKKKNEKKKGKITAPSIEELEIRIGRLKVLNRSVKDIRKVFSGYKTVLKKDPDDSDKKLQELTDLLEKSWNGWKADRAERDISLMEMGLEELVEKDEKIEDIRKNLDKLISEKGDIEKIEKMSQKVRKDMVQRMEKYPDMLFPEAFSSFERSMDSFEEIAGSNVEITTHKKYFKKLITLFKKKDLKNILVYSNLLYTTSQSDIGDEVSKDRFKLIRDEITSMMGSMDEFKKYGLDNQTIEKELKRLEKGLDTTRLSDAKSTLSRLTKNISRTEKEYYRRKGSVSVLDTEDLIQEFGSIIDLKEQEKKLKEIKSEVTTKPPKKFLEESNAVMDEVKSILYTNFEGEVQQRMQAIDLDLETTQFQNESERTLIKELRDSVNSALENRNITEAMEYLSLAESMFSQAENEISFSKVRSRYTGLLGDIENLLNDDSEMEDLRSQLDDLEKLFLVDDINIDNILFEVERAENNIRTQVIDIREKDFVNIRQDIVSKLDRIDIKEERREAIIKDIDTLGSSIPDIKDETYRSKLTDLRNDVDQEISSYFRDNYNQWIGRIQGSLESTNMGEDLTGSINQGIEEAGRSFRERDYLNSGNLLCDISDQILEFENDREIEEAEALINSAEFLFQEATRAGVNVEDQSQLLIQAKELLESGDVSGSKDMASLIESSVKTKWMEEKKSHLREDLNGLKDYYMESTELGLDIEDASSILDEAESYFEKEMYDEVNDKVFQARETIEQKRKDYFSTGTMDTISDLKMDIDRLKDLGISTVEAETLLIEAERLFMEEEYEKSYAMTLNIKEQLNFSSDSYLKEDVPKKIDDLVGKVGKLEMMGLDTELARSYLDNSTKMMETGDLMNTLDNLSKADEISSEIYRSHVSLTLPETIVDVQKQIEVAQEEGLILDDISGLLKEAENMFNNGDYDLAIEAVERVQSDFDSKREDFYKSRYMENVGVVEDMLGSAQGLEGEMDLSRDNINMARDAFERGDFEISHKLMDKVLKYIERSVDDKEVTKRREVVQTYFDEVKTLISVAEGENIDVTEEKNMFSLAGDLMVKNDFDQAEHVLEGIKLGIQEKRVSMKRRLIESSIQTTEILLDNMNEMGVDTTYERGLIEQLKDALRRGDLDSCDMINSQLQQALHKNQGPFLVQSIQRELSDFRGRMIDANKRGVDTSGVQSHLSKAIEHFEMGDIDNSRSDIARGTSILDDAERIHFQEIYQQTLKDLKDNLDRLKKLGIPTEDEEELVALAQMSVGQDSITDGTAYLETAIVGSKAKLNSFQATTAEGYIHQLDGYLGELRSNGVDTEDLMKVYNEGMELHNSGEDEKAIAKFSSILELGEEVRVQKAVVELKKRHDDQVTLYQDLRTVGMRKNAKLEKTLESSGKMIQMESFDVDKITPLIEKIENLLLKKAIPFHEKLAKKHISDARTGLKELEEKDGESESLRNKIREAAEHLRNKDFERADQAAMEIINAVEVSKISEIESLLNDEVTSVKQMLTRLKTLGSNVKNAEKLLSKAESALLDGRIENAEKLIKNVRESVKEIVRRNMRETSLETIEFVDAMIHYLIDNFSGVSSKLGPAENKLDEARNLFMKKKFKAAKTTGEEARKLIEDLDIANIKQFFYVFQSSQATEMSRNVEIGIAELKKKGIDVTKVKMLYDKAQENFEKDEFDKGRQMITLSRIMLAEIDQQSLRDKAFDELNNAHVSILTRKRKGGVVTSAYNIYNNAKEAFSMREYKKAILLAKKASLKVKKS